MQTIVNLPDSLYQESEALAASRGATVEQLIVEAVKKRLKATSRQARPVPMVIVTLNCR
jgi:hypothetical protein